MSSPVSHERISEAQELLKMASSKDDLKEIAKKNREARAQNHHADDTNNAIDKPFNDEVGLGVISIG